MSQFFFHYPRLTSPKLSHVILFLQGGGGLLFTGYYIFQTLNIPPQYDFAEHAWNFPVPAANKILGFAVISEMATTIAVGIWSIIARKEGRRTTVFFVVVYALMIIAPTIANGLSRSGAISRQAFLGVYTVNMVAGSFALLILYINTTRDETHFISRITSVCLGAFLLLTFALAASLMGREETAYETIRIRDVRAVLQNPEEPGDALYAAQLSSDGTVSEIRNFSESAVDWSGTSPPADFPGPVFRKNTSGLPAVIAFRLNSSGGKIKEVGFPYNEYRTFLHNTVSRFVMVLAAALVVVLFGFRYFLSGALWVPLRRLLDGIRNVNAGDLSIQVPVRVMDEIGFLSDSFNHMVNSVSEARAVLARHAETLEAQVKERTSELTKLIESQNGDYFLTSLLLRPLGRSTAANSAVRIEMLTEQYKKFVFKDRTDEIGGDISTATTLLIGQTPCTVFLNADAMGKSIQGAGGAIVLGVLFGSLINRARITAQADMTPQRWIRSAFLELAQVFEIFDGSMLVSAVLGVIDESQGIAYLVNAEHPAPVLYRNERAQLLPMRSMQKRLGLPVDLGAPFSVHALRLQAGDVLIIGSDGKDDVVIQEADGDNNRVINSNERAFLSHVENAKAHLPTIQRWIKSTGRLSDDFSLLRVEFVHRTAGAPASPERTGEFLQTAKTEIGG